jgi:hypothetical protein
MNVENNNKKVYRTLILPDLHHQWEKAEKIIKYESADQIVFLGDYQDDFGDDYRIALETAKWLKSSLEKPNRIHLMGNHDINYAIPHRSYKCSGYEAGKDYAINSVLKESDWRKLKTHTWVGSYLCSHAGVHKFFYEKYGSGKPFNTWIDEICTEAMENAYAHKPALPILRAGRSRGGIEMYGGIMWCDSSEFVGIDGINQIFGHTPSKMPYWKDFGSPTSKEHSRNLALDNYGHSNYYAIHVNDVVTIKWIGDI